MGPTSVIEVEEVVGDSSSIGRSCNIRVGNKSIVTPSRAVAVTLSKTTELDVAIDSIKMGKTSSYGELYCRLSIDFLNKIMENDFDGHKFSSRLSNRLTQLKEAGTIPYIMISFTDGAGNPYNRLPSEKVLNLLFNILWGTEGNQIIIPPLMGVFNDEKQYVAYLDAIQNRILASSDRKDIPLMANIPVSYRLIAPHILKKYWDMGCRVFSMDLEGKKYGAYGYIIEKLHHELSELSKKDMESYSIHALNTRQRTGRGLTSRVNDLLCSGYGFDSFGPSHGSRKRWVPADVPSPPIDSAYLLDESCYGFHQLSQLAKENLPHQNAIMESKYLRRYSLEELMDKDKNELTQICSKHNVDKEFSEVKQYPYLIENNELLKYFQQKERIKREVEEMKKFFKKEKLVQGNLEQWL